MNILSVVLFYLWGSAAEEVAAVISQRSVGDLADKAFLFVWYNTPASPR
jgi:hypothetical protein